MPITVIALGNPGAEFDTTRHNAGRVTVEPIAKSHGQIFENKPKTKSLVATIELEYDDVPKEMQHHVKKTSKAKATLVLPESYMNNSGQVAVFYTDGAKAPKQLVVVHDDLDLGLGDIKVSYDRGPGGHKGVASIIKSLKTQQFLRIRVGISPVTPKGVMKKLIGPDAVERHILGSFKPADITLLKKLSKKVQGIIATYALVDLSEAMKYGNTD